MVTDEDLVENDTRRAAEELFGGSENESYEEILTVAQLPGVDQRVAEILKEAGYDDIEVFVSSYESGALNGLDGVTKEQLDEVYSIINENVEFEDEEEPQQTADSAEEDSEEEYFCPECGEKITPDMTRCPKCGVEFSFEEE